MSEKVKDLFWLVSTWQKSMHLAAKEESTEAIFLINLNQENKGASQKYMLPLDSSLKHCEIKLSEQTTAKEACLRDLEDLQEVEREQQNLIRLQKDKIRRMEMEMKGMKEENKRKEETLNNCRIDLLQLEKEKGQLSAVSYENKALKENCILLEKSLDKFNDCQGRVSILEQSLFKSKETLHDKEEAIVDLQKSNQELKQKAKDANLNLAKEKQEIKRLKIALDASNTFVQKTEEKLAAVKEELNQFQIDHRKLKDEKTKLENIYQGSVDAAAELKILLENKHHMENVLEDRMKTLNAHLQEKNQAIDLIRKEKEHKEIMHTSEINQLNDQIVKMHKHSSERDDLLNSLREEQSMHRKQLKQLQVALQTSLSHIRGLKVLMQQSSTASIQSEIDEAALKDLLQLVPNRPRLTGLKLCLADLKRDVKELNLQLGDRSRGPTPTGSLRTDTPSFLERFSRDSGESSGSATPSLLLSSTDSSAQPSPQHVGRR